MEEQVQKCEKLDSSLKVESADGNLPECLNLADLTHTLKHAYSKAVHQNDQVSVRAAPKVFEQDIMIQNSH